MEDSEKVLRQGNKGLKVWGKLRNIISRDHVSSGDADNTYEEDSWNRRCKREPEDESHKP